MKKRFAKPVFAALAAAFACANVSGLRGEATDVVYAPSPADAAVESEPVRIIVGDAIASPGRPAALRARVERTDQKLFKSAGDAALEFAVDGSSVGQARTGGNGAAEATATLEGFGPRVLSVRLIETDLYRASTGYGLLSVLSSSQPILLVDFDSSLYKGLSGKFQFRGVERLRPVDGAADALARLAERYQIVYVTEYEMSQLPKMRRWLHHWKLPKFPILSWDLGGKVLKDQDWKARQLRKLLKDWPNIRAGVGGASDVLRAYRRGDLKSVPVQTGLLQEPGARDNWKEVRMELEADN